MRRSAYERYEEDPQFHALVNLFYRALEDGEFTPTEIREAAMVAATKFEMTQVRSIILTREQWDAIPADIRARLQGGQL